MDSKVFGSSQNFALSHDLSAEEQRHVREPLTEEELTVFDLLTRPGPDSSPESAMKWKVARHLLHRVRSALVLNWRQKAQARVRVRLGVAAGFHAGDLPDQVLSAFRTCV